MRIAQLTKPVSTTAAPTHVAPLQCVGPMLAVQSALTVLSAPVLMALFPIQHPMLPVPESPLPATLILTVPQALCAA